MEELIEDWGIRQTTSCVIYNAVFLPRITDASEVWWTAACTVKAVKLLGSRQRRPLLSITGAYRTTSTDALQMVAGKMPLDLEIRYSALGKDMRAGVISREDLTRQYENLLDIWQARWDVSAKGRWSYAMMPDVRDRLGKPLELDHYGTQFLTGHGDFNSKLESFALRNSGLCRCGLEATFCLGVRYSRKRRIGSGGP